MWTIRQHWKRIITNIHTQSWKIWVRFNQPPSLKAYQHSHSIIRPSIKLISADPPLSLTYLNALLLRWTTGKYLHVVWWAHQPKRHPRMHKLNSNETKSDCVVCPCPCLSPSSTISSQQPATPRSSRSYIMTRHLHSGVVLCSTYLPHPWGNWTTHSEMGTRFFLLCLSNITDRLGTDGYMVSSSIRIMFWMLIIPLKVPYTRTILGCSCESTVKWSEIDRGMKSNILEVNWSTFQGFVKILQNNEVQIH